MPNQKDDDFDFEIIDENEVELVKKGRKANINHKLLEAMKKLPTGKVIKLPSHAVEQSIVQEVRKLQNELATGNPQDKDAKNARLQSLQKEIASHKAKYSANIRAHAEKAKWENASIKWSIDYCPIVSRIVD